MANALPSYINAGTATVAANGTVVTGQGTSWLTNVRPGDMFGTHKCAGVRIAAVNSNTSLTLAYPWLGGAQTASAYEIGITPDTARMQETTRSLLETLTNGNLEAFAGLTLAADRLPYATGAGAMGLTPLTAFARSLLDDADAAAARTTLELVKQTSATDATAGRLMGVGAFGLGGLVIPLGNTDDLNNLPAVTAFYGWGGGLPANTPTANSGCLIQIVRSSGVRYQYVLTVLASLYVRVCNPDTSTWTSWRPITPTRITTSAGTAIRFADGTQICTSPWLALANTPANSGGEITWSYPAEFVAEPNVSGIGRLSTSTTDGRSASATIGLPGAPGTTSLRCHLRNGATDTATIYASLTAIGRYI